MAATAAWPSGGRSSCPAAGPSGGDGGRGGDVIMESSQRHNTLIHFRYNPEHKAQRGEHGMGSNCSGSDGRSIVLQVPVGTSLYDQETGELVHDFSTPDERLVVAKGGRGGRGNQHFATSTHQAPREHELGRAGRGADLPAGIEAAGRCRAGRLSQRRQVDADFAHLGRQAEDRRLPVHDAGTQSGRGHGGRGAAPGVVRGGRRAGPDRGRAPGLGPWRPVPAPHRADPACWSTWWMCRTPRAGPIRWRTSR